MEIGGECVDLLENGGRYLRVHLVHACRHARQGPPYLLARLGHRLVGQLDIHVDVRRPRRDPAQRRGRVVVEVVERQAVDLGVDLRGRYVLAMRLSARLGAQSLALARRPTDHPRTEQAAVVLVGELCLGRPQGEQAAVVDAVDVLCREDVVEEPLLRGEGRGARGEGRGARGEGRGARGEGRGCAVLVSTAPPLLSPPTSFQDAQETAPLGAGMRRSCKRRLGRGGSLGA